MRQKALLALTLVVAVSPALAQRNDPRPDPKDTPPLVRLMLKAAESLKYSGTLQVTHREGPRRVVTKQYILRDGKKSRVWFPRDSGSAGEVITEDGKTRRHYQPRNNRILTTPIEEGEARRRLVGLVRGAKFEIQDGGVVAGRDTSVIAIKEQNGRVRQRMWVDTQNGLVLKREILDNVGSREGYFEFLEVDFSPKIEPGDFLIQRGDAREVTLYDVAREIATGAGISAYLIPSSTRGFQLMSARVMDTPNGKVLHQSYSSPNGLISLFQSVTEFPERVGGPESRLKTYRWKSGRFNFLLMGSPDKSVLEEIAGKVVNH